MSAWWLAALGAIASALAGLCVGSFVSLAADRLPRHASLWLPRSHCDWCGHLLTPRELVPVLGYARLKGRCSACAAPIGVRPLLVELATAILFVLVWFLYGPTLRALLSAACIAVLILVYVIDVEHHLVLSVVIVPATLLGLCAIPLQALIQPPSTLYVAWLAPLLSGTGLSLSHIAMLSQGLGLLSAFGIFWLIWRAYPAGMGYGDVRLSAFVGLLSGFPGAIWTVFGGIMLGGVVAVALVIRLGKRALKTYIAFAPFLVIAALVMLLFGDAIMSWYLGR